MVLANLETLDNEVMSEMKSEAFDLVRACSKSEAALAELAARGCSIKSHEREATWASATPRGASGAPFYFCNPRAHKACIAQS